MRKRIGAVASAFLLLGIVAPALAASEPIVGFSGPLNATVNQSLTLSGTYSDPDGISSCSLYVSGENRGQMSLTGGSTSGGASLSHTFTATGTYPVHVRCTDVGGNVGSSVVLNVTVSSSSSATTPPIVGAVTPLSATANASASFTASYSDNDSVTGCSLFVNGENRGAMNLSSGGSSGTASLSTTFTASGSSAVQARCTDILGNVGFGPLSTLIVSSQSPSFVVSAVSPGFATVGASSTFSVTYTGSVNVSSCSLYADGSNLGAMSLNGSMNGTATFTTSFGTSGTRQLQARCVASNGDIIFGTTTPITVSASADSSAPSMPGSLTRLSIDSDNTASFAWNASSDNMGVASYEVSVDGGAYYSVGNVHSTELAVLANGAHTVSVRARDSAGNVSSATSLTFTVNASAGTGPVTFTLDQMRTDANAVVGSTRASLEATTGRTCELSSLSAASRVSATAGSIADASMRSSIENFTACGTPTSISLGAGERLGVVNSYRAAFGRWPSTSDHWFDVMKIANGRFPGEVSASAEADARVRFRAVYLREANANVTADANAVTVMAYGLRPLPRNLNSEAAAIVTFRAVYGRMPSSARDWDTVRAVAYSGATR